MAYTLTKRQLTTLRAGLTRAIGSGDAAKVAKQVKGARVVFDSFGYPDCWSRWQRAWDDYCAHDVRFFGEENPFHD